MNPQESKQVLAASYWSIFDEWKDLVATFDALAKTFCAECPYKDWGKEHTACCKNMPNWDDEDEGQLAAMQQAMASIRSILGPEADAALAAARPNTSTD